MGKIKERKYTLKEGAVRPFLFDSNIGRIVLFIFGIFAFILSRSNIGLLNLFSFVVFIPLFIIVEGNKRYKYLLFYVLVVIGYFVSFSWFLNVIGLLRFSLFVSINSLFFILPFLTIVTRTHYRWILFATSFLGLEYLQLNSDLSMPLNILGNNLLEYPSLIQWYEFSGVLGGSLLIIVVNICLYLMLCGKAVRFLGFTLIVIFTTLLLATHSLRSRLVLSQNEQKFKLVNTYFPCEDTKYELRSEEMRDSLVTITNSVEKINSVNSITVWPETSMTALIEEQVLIDKDPFNFNESLDLRNNTLIFGCFTTQHFYSEEEYGFPLNKGDFKNEWYRLYNSVAIKNSRSTEITNKKKLVPFNEGLPFQRLLVDYILPLYSGKFRFSKGKDLNCFETQYLKIAPLICYETFFGNFTRRYTQKGADVIVNILNEGWYNNKRGAEITQNLAIARAIETRKPVLRSSNCGFTSYIDPTGKVVKQMIGKNSVLSTTISTCKKETFYQKFGDDMGTFSIFLFLSTTMLLFLKRAVSILRKY